MWSGAVNAIPAGWALCDGGSGRPDLRDRFIVGAAAATPSAVRAREHAQAHVCGNACPQPLDHVQDRRYTSSWKGDSEAMSSEGKDYYNGWSTKYTSSTGADAAHENRPPYYALCFIIKL
jgi:microcystin-dependent protein